MLRYPVAISLLLLTACQPTTPAMAPAVTRPVVQAGPQRKYQDAKSKISFEYPADWTDISDTDHTDHTDKTKGLKLKLQSPDKASTFALTVPPLPWHPAIFLTIGRVTDGYLDDAKTQQHATSAQSKGPVALPDADASRVSTTLPPGSEYPHGEAVLIVHNDTVYVLEAGGTVAGFDAARQALDHAVMSLRWTK